MDLKNLLDSAWAKALFSIATCMPPAEAVGNSKNHPILIAINKDAVFVHARFKTSFIFEGCHHECGFLVLIKKSSNFEGCQLGWASAHPNKMHKLYSKKTFQQEYDEFISKYGFEKLDG